MSEKKHEYSPDNFIYSTTFTDLSSKSEFDNCLCASWDSAMKNGAFWYTLDQVKTKEIPGKYKMVAQLNEKRHSQRRKPQSATEVLMPFDEKRFNFNKIKDEEILFKLSNKAAEHSGIEDWIIINVSPIVYSHVLLVPNPSSRKPQTLDEHAVRTAAEMCLMSATRAFCAGFNSLCALASVNHQHLHACYIEEEIPIDRCDVKQLKENIYCLQDFMVNGFVVQLLNNDVTAFTKSIISITDSLLQNNIAHNLFMRRKKSFQSSTDQGSFYVTVYIFPKKVCPDVSEYPFSPAAFELCGFPCVRNAVEYEELTEGNALCILQRYTYNEKEFQDLWEIMKQEVS